MSADDDDYQNADSPAITGNRRIVCTLTLSVEKTDRDLNMFGVYKVKLGARVFESASAENFVSLG